MTQELIIYGLVFLGVLVLVEGVYLSLFGKQVTTEKKVNRRLVLMEKATSRDQVLAHLRKELDMHDKARSVPVYSLLAEQMRRAAIPLEPSKMILIIAAICAIIFVALSLFSSTGFSLRLLVSIVGGIGGVFFWVGSKAKKRMDMIEEQLPDAIDLMVRAIKVGHPFASALAVAANEVQDPLATELGIVSDEVSYGRGAGEAIADMAERLDMQDMRFLAVAVTIQQQSGGNLAAILQGLTEVIRERFRLFRKVDAITSQAKWSGKVLAGFPVIAIIGLQIMKPDYFDPVLDHKYFVLGCVLVGVFILANLLAMKVLTNIKV